jgi:predicted deacetylase
LIRDCRAWFDEHSLPAPSLYVPPAWAMGSIPRAGLEGLGFRYFETLTGIYDAERREMHRLPLFGFEADTRFRALSLRLFNAANRIMGRYAGTVRLGIHPQDFELELAADLKRCLAEGNRTTSVEALA